MLTNNPSAELAKTIRAISYDELYQVRQWLKTLPEGAERELVKRILAQIEAFKDLTELTQLRLF